MKAGTVALVLVAAGVLAWLYVAMKPEVPVRASAASSVKAAATSSSAEYGAPPAREFDFVVAKGQVTAGSSVLSVTQGAPVMIRVTSDRGDELHLHGYDLELPLKAGVAGSLAFTADKAGRFDLELHHAGVTLAALEVQPK